MAFDKKRERTFDWLDGVSSQYDFGTLIYRGVLYAANEVMLARVEYPEFLALGEWEWQRVMRYRGDDGRLLEFPEVGESARQFYDARYFDNMFTDKGRKCECRFDCRLLKKALKVFEINRISPELVTSTRHVEFSGCNRDVAIHVLVMGMAVKNGR